MINISDLMPVSNPIPTLTTHHARSEDVIKLAEELRQIAKTTTEERNE